MRFTEIDRARVTAAVTAAEQTTDGEIVTIVARHSDRYHDVVLHGALLAMLLTLAVVAIHPGLLLALHAGIDGGWAAAPDTASLLRTLLFTVVLVFLVARLILGFAPIRHAITPGATRSRRVRRRAIDLFRVGVQTHTRRRTGVLLYLSLAERRAEIVADSVAHAAVPPECWGDILSALLVEVRAGRAADGMVTAVETIGSTLATHFPYSGNDAPELPDRLIQL